MNLAESVEKFSVYCCILLTAFKLCWQNISINIFLSVDITLFVTFPNVDNKSSMTFSEC